MSGDVTGFVWVCLGAGLGASGRYLVDRTARARLGMALPWATLVVNVVGSVVLGVLTGVAAGHDLPRGLALALGSGFCGALTTYSTFGYETVRLAEEGAVRAAVLNVVVSLAAGLGAAALGFAVGSRW